MHCMTHIGAMTVNHHSDREPTAAAASESAASNRHAPCTSTHPRQSRLPLALLVALLCTLFGRVQLHAAADPTLLSSLSSSLTETQSAPLVPAFDPAETSYAQNVPNGAREVVFRAVAEEPAASQLWAKWNAGTEFQVQSGVDMQPLPLDTQLINELQLIVRSADADDNIYLISITRSSLVSQNANLLSLAWRAANGSAVDEAALVSSMEPPFSSQIFEYVVQLAPGVGEFSVVGTVEAQATLTWATNRTSVGPPETELDNTAPVVLASGVASPALSLATGQRLKLLLRVLAEDGINARDYAFSIRRAEDAASSVSSSSGVDGSPDFSSTGPDLGAAPSRTSTAVMATALTLAVATVALATATGL